MSMTAAVTPVGPVVRPIAISARELMPWAILVGVVMLLLMYLVGLDQGATSLIGGHFLHEWVHDARHLLGFPCH